MTRRLLELEAGESSLNQKSKKTVIIFSGRKSTGKDTSSTLVWSMLSCKDCNGTGYDAGHIPDFGGDATKMCETCVGKSIGFVKRIENMSFADPLKYLCQAAFGLTHKQCYGESGERETSSDITWDDISPAYHDLKKPDSSEYLTAREVLQFVGTNVMRRFYPNIWAKAATISALRSNAEIVIFTDARFPNEIEEFQKLADAGEIKLVVIRLHRDTGLQDAHESETALDSWDEEMKFKYNIYNEGSMSQLYRMLHDVMRLEGVV